MTYKHSPSRISLSTMVIATLVVTIGGASSATILQPLSESVPLQAELTPQSGTGMTVREQARLQRKAKLKQSRKTKRTVRGIKRDLIKKPITRTIFTGSLLDATPVEKPTTPVKSFCGDGYVLPGEACDDKNTKAGDGCSATCTVETGFECTTAQPSMCWSRCGDAVVAANEKCDDGNMTAGDGCSAACKIEIGFVCSGNPSECEVTPYCGDGIKASTEDCDDGNSVGGDGCYQCETE